MSDSLFRQNLSRYQDHSVVNFYQSDGALSECEQHLFNKYVHPSDSVLDLGVGGGRTTPLLSKLAKNYLGIDYSAPMVQACQKKYPALKFQEGDARNLSFLENSSIDITIFSFNGIDYLPTDSDRQLCLREMNRILRPDGRFVFSVHNARKLLSLPDFRNANLAKKAWRTLRAVGINCKKIPRQFLNSSFWKGEGYSWDPTHGGLYQHVSTPEFVISETSQQGFSHLETLSDSYPRKSGPWTTPWYYYVFKKSVGQTR